MATKKGMCGACFRPIALTDDGRVMRHGWKEKGGRRLGQYGVAWHDGHCFGTGWLPYEGSAECTKAYIEQVLFPIGVQILNWLERLETRPDMTYKGSTRIYIAEVVPGYPAFSNKSVDAPWMAKVLPGDASFTLHTSAADTWGTRVPSYKDLWTSAKRETEIHWDLVAKEGYFACQMVEKWVPSIPKDIVKKLPITHYAQAKDRFAGCRRRTMSMYGKLLRRSDDWAIVNCPKCLEKRP